MCSKCWAFMDLPHFSFAAIIEWCNGTTKDYKKSCIIENEEALATSTFDIMVQRMLLSRNKIWQRIKFIRQVSNAAPFFCWYTQMHISIVHSPFFSRYFVCCVSEFLVLPFPKWYNYVQCAYTHVYVGYSILVLFIDSAILPFYIGNHSSSVWQRQHPFAIWKWSD